MTIEGHCDERGTLAYNLVLGEKRAKAVQTYLIGAGHRCEPSDASSHMVKSGPSARIVRRAAISRIGAGISPSAFNSVVVSWIQEE